MNTKIFCFHCEEALAPDCHCSNSYCYHYRGIRTPSISVGDIVKLKSGSVHMTVCTIESGEAHCRWYDSDFQFIRLPLAGLVKV